MPSLSANSAVILTIRTSSRTSHYRVDIDEQSGLQDKRHHRVERPRQSPRSHYRRRQRSGAHYIRPPCRRSPHARRQSRNQTRRNLRQDSRVRQAAPATSPVVCPASPNSSRPATRLTPPSFLKSTAKSNSAKSNVATARFQLHLNLVKSRNTSSPCQNRFLFRKTTSCALAHRSLTVP